MNVRMGWNAALGIALLLVSLAASAGGAAAVREQAEASMLVTGRIQVDSEGHVTGHSLDEADKVPAGVVALIGKAVPAWRFKPTLRDGKPVRVATDMRIRVVARKLDGDNFEVSIRSATFGETPNDPAERVRPLKMTPPDYPLGAAKAGVTGTVYLLLRVGRDGKARDAIAEQTNLTMIANDNVMDHGRRVLEDRAISQSRKWWFAPPTLGEEAKEDFWVVRVPVVFELGDRYRKKPAYGSWQGYVPGPRQRNPWSDGTEGAGFSPDTLAPGGIYLAGSALKLLTPLSGS